MRYCYDMVPESLYIMIEVMPEAQNCQSGKVSGREGR